jgi:ribosome-associated translation inhibitor RaiA
MKRTNSSNANKTNIRLLYRGLSPRALWQTLIEEHMSKLQHLAQIASARIILQRNRQSKPAFHVSATLEVPGPDFHAAASDYTLRAALLKVAGNLRRQMQSRKARQVARRKSKSAFGLLHRSIPSMP